MAAPRVNTEPRRRLIAQIHIARKELGLDDDTYRAALLRITGKTSCANLGVPELTRVVSDFQEKGWKKKNKLSPRSRGRQYKTLVDKIRALWIDMAQAGLIRDGSEQALQSWVSHQTSRINGGIGIERVDWLERDRKLSTMVLESLKKWQDRAVDELNADLRVISDAQVERDRPQADVVRELLVDRRIIWRSIFAELDIEQLPEYAIDRRSLRHD